MAEIASRLGCTRTYTWSNLEWDIQALYGAGVSLRQISHDIFCGEITHSTVQRILEGHEPESAKIRLALGLPALVEVEPCRYCSEVHTLNGICTKLSAVDLVIRLDEYPRPMKIKTVRPRAKGTRPRLHYKQLYLDKCREVDELKAQQCKYATMEE